MQFASENRRALEAAQGYLTLGLYRLANDELESMTRESRRAPEVLAIKLAIFSGLGLWEMAEIAAWQLADSAAGDATWAQVAESAKLSAASHRREGGLAPALQLSAL